MTEPLRIVFAGTPEFAAEHLKALLDSPYQIVAVYTQPDRPAGRGQKLMPSPVKQLALENDIPVLQPPTLRNAEAQAELAALKPDLMVVVAYGLILPQAVLDIPRLGCINSHASLLPRWRGAAPIQRAVQAGDAQSGVTVMRMEAGLDTGPMLLKVSTPISAEDTGGSLHDRLAVLGAEVLADGLARVVAGEWLVAREQPGQGVTYAHKLDKAEARLDWSLPAPTLERTVRAFDPWPVAEADIGGERLRIWSARAADMPHAATPGQLLAAGPTGIDVACGEGVLRILEVQRAGGRRIAVRDYLNARPELKSTAGSPP